MIDKCNKNIAYIPILNFKFIIWDYMNQLNQNNQTGKKLINCRESDIISLLKIKDDRKNFCMEMSKKYIINIKIFRLAFPGWKWI